MSYIRASYYPSQLCFALTACERQIARARNNGKKSAIFEVCTDSIDHSSIDVFLGHLEDKLIERRYDVQPAGAKPHIFEIRL